VFCRLHSWNYSNDSWALQRTPINWKKRLTRAAAALVITFLCLAVPVAALESPSYSRSKRPR
jgi:hypothetical protein